ncbi:hypothetical protein HDV01_005419 [Terramyces sp. JEL0728]|nr:hypothetical protein HDV01_005419 [Terramyces sp. JEL0728]
MECPVISSNVRDAKPVASELDISVPQSQPNVSVSSIPDRNQSSGTQGSEVTGNENARRLAEYVAKMDELRETTGAQGFKNTLKQESEGLLNNLYLETRTIERNVFVGEVEIFKRNEDAFFTNLNELEILDLKNRQEEELSQLKIRQAQVVKDFEARKLAKFNTLKQQRELKMLYLETQFRAEVSQKTEDIKEKLSLHRQKVTKIMQHIEERHSKQTVQFNAAEDRSYKNKKLLLQLQCASLSEEERGEAEKKFQARLNHQKVIHKKRLEHTQEQQRLELRHFKEKSDFQGFMVEELAYLKTKHYQQEQDLVVEQKVEYYAAKDKIQSAKKALKLADFKYHHNAAVSKMKALQRNKIRELVKEHKEIFSSRKTYWEYVLGKEQAYSELTQDENGDSTSHSRSRSQNNSNPQSNLQSKAHSRINSDVNVRQTKKASKEMEEEAGKADTEEASFEKEAVSKLQGQLTDLRKKQTDILYQLKSENDAAYAEMKEKLDSDLAQMELNHDVERKRGTQDADSEINELLQNQEKEIELENHIRAAETKALIERKVLINMLDTFTDGVISIDNRGFIKRFNNAAEKMFGYTATEIFESNMNIKSLMPKEQAAKHDTCTANLTLDMYNYFTTGVKKVIGKGISVSGMKKDGTKFPIHLSLSEVVESGFHQFTAIIRDMTSEVEAENYKQSTETQMIWSIDRNGKVLSLNKRFKAYVGITTKEQEETASVFSEDVVHPNEYQLGLDTFAKANRDLKPFEIKRRLKSVTGEYRWFLTKGIPVFDTKGKFKQWYGACTDIDDAVLLEAELNTLQEKLPVFIWKSDPFGELYYGNTNFSQYAGIDISNEKPLMYSEKLCFGQDYELVQEMLERARTKKTVLDFKFRLKSKQAKVRWFHCSGSPILDPNGKLLSFYGLCKDINEAEQAAREMVLLPESLPLMIWKVDPQGNVVYCNSRFTRYIGAPPGAMLNVFDPAVVHPDDYNASYNAFATGTREKKTFLVKRRLKCGDGTYNCFLTKGTPIFDDTNNIVGWYGTCTPEE